MASNEATSSPIAIIGMGLRLPGGISTPDQFWNLLVNKKDGKCRVPADRYNVDAFSGENTQKQKVASDHGYFLDHVNLKAFDAAFFSAKKTEVEVTDPQQRLLLEVVWECMESAGQTGLQGTNTGVYVGAFGEDWHNILHRDEQIFSAYRVLSAGDYALANRLSHEYDLRGPSMTIRTACSASLTGLHLACQALQNGDCDNAIVAGSSIIMDPSMTLDMSQQGVLSPSGCCKTFDADADGFARGEAINAILIKPLDKALKDGDPIRAVIRSTAVNSDGKTSHMGSPSTESQEAMIRRAYEAAGIHNFSETAFFECHGTGTAVGDPLEVAAVGNVFGETGAYIGSVKPNVGHGEGASGLTSIIKAVLSVENETIPPNINFATPNPKIPFQKFKLEVPVEPLPWPKDRLARVSVNSFGIGGANAHVIIDSASAYNLTLKTNLLLKDDDGEVDEIPKGESQVQRNRADNLEATDGDDCSSQSQARKVAASPKREDLWWPQILPVSAKTAKSLEGRIKALRQYIHDRPGSLNDVAHTLGLRRIHLPHRSYSIIHDGPLESLEFSSGEKIGKLPSSEDKIAFVFTGQGAQWVGMGRSLVQSSPTFREDIRAMDNTLQRLPNPPDWSLESLLASDDEEKSTFSKAQLSQPLCTAIQIGIVNFLGNSSIRPSAIVGHSSGEIAGAYSAGVMTMDEAIICAYYRGQTVNRLTRQGRMAAIGMSYQETQSYLVEGAQVGCENSPQSVTISGNQEAVSATIEMVRSKRPEVFTRELQVEVAYHSNHMQEIGQVYEDWLTAHIDGNQAAPQVPFYSSVTGTKEFKKDSFGPKYWRSNLESTVLFRTAVSSLISDIPDLQTLVEIGPHSALQGPLRQILQDKFSQKAPTYIPTLTRGSDSVSSILKTIGQLYSRGHDVDFGFVNPTGSFLHNLPSYAWDHSQEFWKEGRVAQAWRLRKHAHHELLGSRCPESTDLEPIWRNMLHESDAPWLKDHRVENNVVFPCAGYIAMMGEAIRQTTGVDAYVLRNLTVKAALMLPDMEHIEIRTTMKPTRITERTSSSRWVDISISTLTGSTWVENCAAQGMAGENDSVEKEPIVIEPEIRHITSEYFYDRMSFLGLRYGPRFQALRDISSSICEHVATATVVNQKVEKEAKYAVHPTAIDNCLQLYAVAGCRGITRHMDTLALPIDIRGVTVRPAGPELLANAELDTANITGSVVAVDSETSQLVLKLDDTKGIPFDTGDPSRRKETQDLARLEWLPHIDYLDPANLIRRQGNSKREERTLCNKLALLGVLKTLHLVEGLDQAPAEHLEKYVSWLRKEKMEMTQGKYESLSPDPAIWSVSSTEAWDTAMKSLLDQVQAIGCPMDTNVARIIYDAAQPESVMPIFTGKQSSVEVLAADDRLVDFYRFQAMSMDVGDFFRLCAHVQPTLRVLEIGAGTGSTTEQILPTLQSDDGVRMYSRYVFSDISPGFFADAKERFQDHKGIEYKVLDVEKDPIEQGFELGSFDVIVASNTLHATKSLNKTLCNVRSLLRPGGRLYLDELVLLDEPTKPLLSIAVPFLMGRLPGWWNGEFDGRSDVPFVSVERWDQELRAAGFSGSDSAVLDEDYPYQICAHITSTAIVSKPKPETVIMLYKDKKVDFGRSLVKLLGEDGVDVQWLKLGDTINTNDLPKTKHVISTIDLEGPFLDEISEEDYNTFIRYITKLKGGILWLTRPAQVATSDPRYGIINGIARTIRIELAIDFWTAELASAGLVETAESTLKICRNFCAREPLKHGVDVEFFVQDGIVHVGRYHWTSLEKAIEPRLPDSDPKSLIIGQYGLLDSLGWVQQEAGDLQPDEVELDVRCVGLNFRDIMVAMGLVPMEKDSLGFEATGVIQRVGSAVQHVKPGDRVFCIGKGLFATRKILSANNVAKVPDCFTLEQAVTMPVVYATVIYSLIHVGQLKKGQSVLIHSGTGGVGQAAITICQMLGAEIFVTVGSDEKAQYLVKQHNIPRDKIFDSHSTSFLGDVRAATNGRGVDLVLNSLSGELLHASWQCVAPCGKMMEIGKRDILEHGQLALDMFRSNRTFFGIDLESLFHDRPESLRSLTDQLVEFSENGHIKPIEPIHTFPAQKIPEAIRFMKKGEHMGKIVITMPKDPQDISASKVTTRSALLSDSSTYLVVGGLGGLGKSVTRWMIEKGARHFCFLSRSAGTSTKDQAFLKEIESQGCKAVAVAGSVSEMTDVCEAIDMSPSPIAGVLQMSMVIRDRPILETSYQDWRIVHDCKVKGTWNLHHALDGVALDFFILMSSISGSVGHPGQANYTSANSFLDSFAQYRQSLGLPCSSINLGGMEGVGFLSERPAKLNQYRSFGLHILHEQHLVDSIQLAMTPESKTTGEWREPRRAIGAHTPFYNANQHVVGLNTSKPLADPTNRALYKGDPRVALYHNIAPAEEAGGSGSGGSGRDEGVRELLAQAEADPRMLYEADTLEKVSWEIGRTLFSFLLLPEEDLDISLSLSAIGIDSLVSIEIRNWWRKFLGLDITVLQILNASTISGLGQLAIDQLKEKFGAKDEDEDEDKEDSSEEAGTAKLAVEAHES